jgi:hypothetical protein
MVFRVAVPTSGNCVIGAPHLHSPFGMPHLAHTVMLDESHLELFCPHMQCMQEQPTIPITSNTINTDIVIFFRLISFLLFRCFQYRNYNELSTILRVAITPLSILVL